MDSVCCDYYLVDDKENIIKQMDSLKDPIGCGIMFRLKHLIELGLYNAKFLRREDEELMNDLNAHDIEEAIKIIAGSARSMGIEVKE